MYDYNIQAKLYWWVTALLGLAVLAVAGTQVALLEQATILEVLLGTLLTALTALFPVRIPGTKTSVAVADVFAFVLLLHVGPAAAAVAAAAEAGVISLRTSKRWTSRLGSPAMAAMAMYSGGIVFAYGMVHFPITPGTTCALAMASAVTYFAVGTLLMMSLIKLKRVEPVVPWRILLDHRWLGLSYAASASTATLLYISFARIEASVIFAAISFVAIFVSVMHAYTRHMAAASRPSHV